MMFDGFRLALKSQARIDGDMWDTPCLHGHANQLLGHFHGDLVV
jgi:hypothetical protein